MLIDGKLLAEKILEDLRKRVEILQDKKGHLAHLGVIVVGNDPATAAYVRQKKRMGEKIGATVSIYHYPESIAEKEIEESIDFLQKEGSLHGLIIQLPLPKHLDSEKLTNKVKKNIDVDGFRSDSDFEEPIAIAVIRILEEIFSIEQFKDLTNETEFIQWLKPQHVVVMGKGKTGGQPIMHIMQKYGISPTIVDSKTPNPQEITRRADILICAVGKGKPIIDQSMIKEDVILIGIGMHLGPDGKLHADYNEKDIADKAAYYTPVPGGVGPVNAAMLWANVVMSAEKSQ